MTTTQAQVEGEFVLRIHSPRGDRECRFKNLITNAGLNRLLGEGREVWVYAQIGTGTAAPAPTDTALEGFAASTGTLQVGAQSTYAAGPPDYIQASATWRFPLGALNGNFSELGIGWQANGGLWSRALVVTAGGTPTSVQVLADEQLDVTYLGRVYPLANDASGVVVLDGANYAYTLRPSMVSTTNTNGEEGWDVAAMFVYGLTAGYYALTRCYSDTIQARTSKPSVGLASVQLGAATRLSYSNDSFQQAFRFVADLNAGNVSGGIKSMMVNLTAAASRFPMSYQIEFTPTIPKDATKRLHLDIVFSLTRRP